MRFFAYLLRHLPAALRFVARRFYKTCTRLDRLFHYRNEYQEPETWRKATPQLFALEPRQLPTALPNPVVFTGTGSGAASVVTAINADTGKQMWSEEVYGSVYMGGVHVASGTLDSSGFPDVVVAPGAGSDPIIRVLDGHTGEQLPGPLGRFQAFSSNVTGGIELATGDVNGDGTVDIIAAAETPTGPMVKVFSGTNGQVIAQFEVPGAAFREGISITAADLSGNGKEDVIVGAGGSSEVRTYNPLTGSLIAGPLGDFFAFGTHYPGGVVVGSEYQTGILNSGTPELVVGTGPGVTDEVKVFDGDSGSLLMNLYPFGKETGGVHVAEAYIDSQTTPDVVIASGKGATNEVKVYSGTTGQELALPQGMYTFRSGSTSGEDVAADNDPPPPPGGGSHAALPALEGMAFVAVRNQEFDGIVAVATGTSIDTSSLETEIQWGDGTETEGTFVEVSSTVYNIYGQHTYQLEGVYAVGVAMDSTSSETFAGGIADVLAPTDRLEPEIVDGVTASDEDNMGADATYDTVDGWWTVTDVEAVIRPTFLETVTTAESTYTLSIELTGNYFLIEADTLLNPQPDTSTISMTAIAIDGDHDTKDKTDGTPTMNGTTSETDQRPYYTLDETATEATYTWTEMSSPGNTGTSTETTEDGTYVEAYTQNVTGTTSGETDFTDNTFNESWSGTETSIYAMSGYAGPESYETVATMAGALTGTESGTISSDSFTLSDTFSGDYTLVHSTTDEGGSESDAGTGDFTQSFTSSGAEPPSGTQVAAGTVSAAETMTYSVSGVGGDSLDGIISTFTITNRNDNNTYSVSGSETTGSYTITDNDSLTNSLISKDTRSASESADGITGSHVIKGTDTSTPITTTTYTQNGNMETGSYTMSETISTNQSDNTPGSDDTTATGSPSSYTDNETDTGGATTTQASTIHQSGNVYTSSYSRTETDSSTVTVSATSIGSSSDLPGDGEDDIDNPSVSSTTTDTTSDTLTVTGYISSGSFSETETDSSNETDYETDTDSETDDEADGGTDDDVDIEFSTYYETSGDTLSETGNWLTGGYTQTGTQSDNSTSFGTDTNTTSDDEADGETDGETATTHSTDYLTGSGGLYGTGDLLTGDYGQTLTDTGTVSISNFETDTDNGSDSVPGEGSSSDSDSDHSSDYNSGSETTTIAGNDTSDSSTTTSTDTLTGSVYETSTFSDSDTPTQGGSSSDSGNDISTVTESSTSTTVMTENVVVGNSSESDTDTSTSTEYDTSTDTDSGSSPDGASDGGNDLDYPTIYQTSTDTSSSTMDELSGTSTQSETDNGSGSEQDNSTSTDTDHGADGSTNTDVETDQSSSTQTSGDTYTLSGNSVDGHSSQNDSDSSTATETDNSTDTDTDSPADDSTDKDTDTVSSNDTDTSGNTYTLSGNDVSESSTDYSTSSDTDNSTATSTDSSTDTLSDSTTENDLIIDRSKNYLTSGSTLSGLVSGITGSYSQNENDTNGSTNYDTSTDTETDHLVDGSTDGDVDSATSTDFDTGTDSSTMTGNDASDSYNEYESDTDNNSNYENSTDTKTDHLADGSTDGDLLTDLGSIFQTSGSVINTGGNRLSGSYSQTEIDTSTDDNYDNSTSTVTDNLSDGSTDGSIGTDSVTDTDSGGDTVTLTGNDYTGAYSSFETATDSSSDSNIDSVNPTDYLTGSTTNTETETDNSNDSITETDAINATGNEISGTYSQQDVGSESGTSGKTTTDNDGWDGESATSGDTDITIVNEQTTDTQTGNDLTGGYTLTETGTSNPTITDTSVDQTLSEGSTDSPSETWTTFEYGNDATGADTTTTTDTTTDNATLSGTDARGTYSGTSSDIDSTTTFQHGNDASGSFTTTVISSDSSTATISGGDGTTTYTQTATSSDNSTNTTTENDSTGSSSWTSSDTASEMTIEAGSSSTTDYSYTQTDGQTTTETGHADSLTGDNTYTDTETSTSSLYETGSEGSTDSYTIHKPGTGYNDKTTTASENDGEYSITGTSGEISTAIESNTHALLEATFTEILTDTVTLNEFDDDGSGVYTLSNSGSNSDNFVDDGTDASGTFHVTEGSAGTFDSTTTGEQDTGDYTITGTSGDSYSYTETVNNSVPFANPFTETENGSETATSTNTQDGITGAYSLHETGTDLYTLSESGTLTGGTFTETVTGTDSHTTNDTGNTALQTDTSTTTGGGGWTRTSAGSGASLLSGSGTNGYTLVSTGNAIAGSFTESETGTDRYGLVEKFDNVANDTTGNTPGNVVFNTIGLPFRDPSQITQRRDPDRKLNSTEASIILLFLLPYLKRRYQAENQQMHRRIMIDFYNTLMETTIANLKPIPKGGPKEEIDTYELVAREQFAKGKGAMTQPTNILYGNVTTIYFNNLQTLPTDKNGKITDGTLEPFILLAHELTHSTQVYDLGGKSFAADYFLEYGALSHLGHLPEEFAYKNISYEIDAYAMENAIREILKKPGKLDELNKLAQELNLTPNMGKKELGDALARAAESKLAKEVEDEFVKQFEKLKEEKVKVLKRYSENK